MSSSEESDADTSRISGKRKSKLSPSKQTWIARRPTLNPPNPMRSRLEIGATGSTPVGLEDCTLPLRSPDVPVREHDQQEADHGLERAGRRRQADVPKRGQRSIDICVDDVGRRVELGRVARDLVEEAEVCVEDPADREQ